MRIGAVLALGASLALAPLGGAAPAAAHGPAPHARASGEAQADRPAAPPAPALPLDLGGPFALVDHTGRPVRDRDFRGRYMLVFFGYASCPGICPTGLRAMAEALDLLGADGDRVAPILITVDPAHDTPEALAEALPKVDPRLIGLTGTLQALSAAAKAYKVSARPIGRTVQGAPLIEHGSFIYLMGPDGKFLSLFPPIMAPDALAAAIRRHIG